MNTKILKVCLLSLMLSASIFARKDVMHFATLPVIEGAGVYASVKALADDNSGPSTKAASIASLSLMGANGAIGVLALFGPEDLRLKFRKVHRIVAFSVTAVALWLSISGSVDEIDKSARIVSYAYTGLTVIPIIVFSF